MSGQAILLHPDDNVLVCIAPIAAGDRLETGGETVIAAADVAVGHKLARRALKAGDKIFKYGAPIGSMTAPAEPGEWVHAHNLKSDYISTHTRQTVIVEGPGT
jgi:D-threo-aldose 1-dehydrogenase